ncbi:MAG: type IV secretion system DNA-binding domain-containing protein, partial [Candidatus Aenigmatarchaeota archaeon]
RISGRSILGGHMYYVKDLGEVKESEVIKYRAIKVINSLVHIGANVLLIKAGFIYLLPYSIYRLVKNIEDFKKADKKVLAVQRKLLLARQEKWATLLITMNPVGFMFAPLIRRRFKEIHLLQAKGIELVTRVADVASIVNRIAGDFEYLKLIDAVKKYKQNEERDIYLNTYKLSEISEVVLKCLMSELKNKILYRKYKNITQTDIYVNGDDLCKSVLVIGAMGSGKSVFIKNLLAQGKYKRALIFDVKGEYLEQFYRADKDILYNVYDERSLLWDMISDVRENEALAQVIAEAIAEQLSETNRDFWITAATRLFKNALLYSARKNLGYAGIIEYLKRYKKKALESDNKTELSIYTTLEQVIDVIRFCAKLEEYYLEQERYDKFFRINDFIEKEGSNLFITASVLYAKAQMPLLNAFISAVLATLLSRPDNKDYTFCVLDEFLSLKLPEALETQLFTTARSKGLQLCLGMQYIPADHRRERTKQLILNSRYITVIFKTVEPKTLEIIEQNFGEIEHVSIQTTITASQSESFMPLGPNSYFPLKTTMQSASTSEQTQRQFTKIITKQMVAFLPQFHCITILGNDIYLGKVEKFFYEVDKKVNEAFKPIKLTIEEEDEYEEEGIGREEEEFRGDEEEIGREKEEGERKGETE